MLPNMNRLVSSPFFQNKIVLYGSLVLVLLSILRYLANQNINAIVLMALIGLITSYFSKNMIIILLTAFITVFIFEMINSVGVTEGMENKDKKDNNEEKKNEDNYDKKDDKKEDKKDDKKDDKKEAQDSKKTKQGMTKLSPANYNGNDDDDDDDNDKNRNRIDYANTLEQAYDNIENIIGEDGVRGLTDQTKSLMNQQKQLMENMKEMGPLLKSAEGFMKQVTGNGGIGGITEMLKGFATPGGKK
jgi:hypothetical protein